MVIKNLNNNYVYNLLFPNLTKDPLRKVLSFHLLEDAKLMISDILADSKISIDGKEVDLNLIKRIVS